MRRYIRRFKIENPGIDRLSAPHCRYTHDGWTADWQIGVGATGDRPEAVLVGAYVKLGGDREAEWPYTGAMVLGR